MKIRSLTVMIVCLGFLGAGLASAVSEVPEGKWLGNSGQYEPSTTYDKPEYMWQTPNQAATNKVYFNGFIVHDRLPTTDPSTAGGSILVGDAMNFAAMLGFWRDCNKDGYIGNMNAPTAYGNSNSGAYFADSSVDNPVDTSICPPGTEYNTGLVVDEFRAIGPAARVAERGGCPTKGGFVVFSCWSTDQGDVNDEKARVWADFGVPDGRGGSGQPFVPRGMLNDSSSTLDRVDRLVGLSGVLEAPREVIVVDPTNDSNEIVNDTFFLVAPGTWDGKPTFGECGENREFLGGPENQCGLYPLWQAKRLVNDSDRPDERAEPVVTVYDNKDSDGSGSACDDTTLPTGHQMADVDPSVHPNALMDGSLGGTAQNVVRGTNQGKLDGGDEKGKCEAPTTPNVESSPTPTGKIRVNAELGFAPGKRINAFSNFGVTNVPMDGFGTIGGPSSAWDSPYGGMDGGAKWYTSLTYVGGVTNGVRSPMFTTMFADVSNLALSDGGASLAALPSGVQDSHTYGDIQCGGNFDDTEENRKPNEFNWICSKQAWIDDATSDERANVNVWIGHAFDLRDVDCYDQSPGIVGEHGRFKDVNNLEGETVRASCDGGTYVNFEE